MNRTLTALLALTLAGVAQADPAADGKIVFEENCVKCHGDDGRARTWRGWMFFAEDLSDAEWQDRHDDEALLRALRRGPGAMPSYEKRLSEEQQQAVVAYVRTLRR